MLLTKYIQIETKKPILEEYDAYIEGLYARKSKPWLISKDDGIVIVNGTKSIQYTWDTVKDDVNRLKILKRKYYQSTKTLDEEIWQSFICLGQDIWEINSDTYGIITTDGYKLNWESFELMVCNEQYESTPERQIYIQKFEAENADNQIVEQIPSENTEDWYESI